MRFLPKITFPGFVAFGFSLSVGLFVAGALSGFIGIPRPGAGESNREFAAVGHRHATDSVVWGTGEASCAARDPKSERGTGFGSAIGGTQTTRREHGECSGKGCDKSENSASDRPLKISSKPRPGYTSEARHNNVSGKVILKVTFKADGSIGSVTAVKGLPDGLTERAIEAAKKIQFSPPTRKGQPYTVNKTVQYNFTIY
ncbi:MAG: energy transducer TonB [Acidobacteria bacterium]|nr:MAG: energy transducer TonB [Acidobacteriota bacterium]REK01614.1 MAG: energy transducer TonB [Acidobacteriota bacterium]REK14570.1 MAG: energy transducer TonB [Acidobacteriota bacterium]REK45285.1 MAG: energy transducer TonB [Acidobacteriota bacterium]